MVNNRLIDEGQWYFRAIEIGNKGLKVVLIQQWYVGLIDSSDAMVFFTHLAIHVCVEYPISVFVGLGISSTMIVSAVLSGRITLAPYGYPINPAPYPIYSRGIILNNK
jgi:hypothetical protein